MLIRAGQVSIIWLTVCVVSVLTCGPGRGSGRPPGRRKMTPLVFKQHVPNVSENTLGASGPPESSISRSDPRFDDLVVSNNPDIVFKNRRGTNNDRIMSKVSCTSIIIRACTTALRMHVIFLAVFVFDSLTVAFRQYMSPNLSP